MVSCLTVLTGSLLALDGVGSLDWMAVPSTFLAANLVEYHAHRGPMHHPTPGLRLVYQRHVHQHHRFFRGAAMGIDAPQDTRVVLFPLVLVGFFFGLIALPIGIGLFLLAGPNPAFLYVATLALYYLSYESLHAVVHLPETHWINRIRWVAQRKAYHRRHHDPRWMSQCNFNISFPIADYLYGTARPDESNPAPAHAPAPTPIRS